MGLQCQRDLFRLEDDVHYINCAYQAPLMRQAEEAGRIALRQRTRPYTYTVKDFFKPVRRVKQQFAKLIGAPDHERIAVIPSVSYGIATVAANVDLKAGENIVVVSEQFPSNYYAWKRLCAERGAELRVIEAPEKRTDWSMRIAMAINEQTRVLAMGHVHWADGTKFAISGIAQKARSMGALVIIDGTQSIGALPFPFQEVQPDALICAAYKWLLGPYSIGLAYYGPWFDDKLPIEENWITRERSDDFQNLVMYQDHYRPKAFRYSVGESSNFLLVPILLAALKQLNAWRPKRIQRYCQKLVEPYIPGWQEMGFQIPDKEDRAAHLFGIRVPAGTDLDQIKPILRKHQVHVSFRGDALRVSPHLYNNQDDMAALTKVLKAMASTRKRVKT
ncbi:MAG: aminotransferase class V-fold PLP-dependent enzyme [Saprospiraceae bacterium]|nr:aminotransferase class V-fold PLP-dependent enzyme [Saprospiraceae bacterium]